MTEPRSDGDPVSDQELLAAADAHDTAAGDVAADRLADTAGKRTPVAARRPSTVRSGSATPVGSGSAAPRGSRPVGSADGPDLPVAITGHSVRMGDRVFRGLAVGSGGFLLLVMTAIAVFLVWKALPAFTGVDGVKNTGNLFTTQVWRPQSETPIFGVAALFFGTVVSAFLAMLIGVPIAIGIALFIAHYAQRRFATILGGIVDLLAAVPSLVFGMWGLYFLIPRTEGFQSWLSTYFGWLPFLHNRTATTAGQYGQSLLMAGIVLAIMIIPVVSAVSREVFLQVPGDTVDAAWALGATKWEMIRTAVLPFGRAGMISAAMLGLGRALGETIAVALVLNSGFSINWHLTERGGDTFASTIALKFGEASGSPLGIPALITAGLFLFAITLVVNSIARAVIARRKDFVA